MPKKTNFEMTQLGAAEFGALLQEGKIVSVRAGKAIIQHTKKVRGKESTETYHVNLSPHVVLREVEATADAPVKERKKRGPKPKAAVEGAEKPARRKYTRKPKAEVVEGAETETATEKPARRKPGPKPKADKAPKKPGRRKARVAAPEAAEPAELADTADAVDAADASEVTETPAKPEKKKKSAPAHIPWSEDLDEDDYEV